jgi:hypothetical protein
MRKITVTLLVRDMLRLYRETEFLSKGRKSIFPLRLLECAELGRHFRRSEGNYSRHVKLVAVSLAAARKFCIRGERELRSQATAISVSAGGPSSARYTTP